MMVCKNMLFTAFLLVSFSLSAQEQEKIISIDLYGVLSNPYIINQNNYESLSECPTVDGSELAYDFGVKSGVSAKITYSWKENWGISSGLEYLSKGQNYEDDFRPGGACSGVYNVKRKIQLNYFQVPFYIQFRKKLSPKLHYLVDLGVYAALLTSGKEKVIADGNDLTNIDPINEKFKRVDFGIAMLHGFQYAIKRKLLISAAFRVNYSLMDINGGSVKNKTWFDVGDREYSRSAHLLMALQLGVQYRFLKPKSPFNKKDRD